MECDRVRVGSVNVGCGDEGFGRERNERGIKSSGKYTTKYSYK